MTQEEARLAALLHDYSLEITGRDLDSIGEARAAIPAGSRINVTFLGTEEPELRLRTARAIREAGFAPVPHLAARRLRSRDEYRGALAALQREGLSERLFLVGGDPATPLGPYADAHSLIAAEPLAEYGVREVGIAGYPEGHPGIGADALREALLGKLAAIRGLGLEAVVATQFSFDAEAVARWVRSVRELGYEGPIRIGTPGPVGVKRLLRYASRFGVGSSAGIVRKYGFSLTGLMGTAGPDRFLRALAAEPGLGDIAVHFYTFGSLAGTAAWARDAG